MDLRSFNERKSLRKVIAGAHPLNPSQSWACENVNCLDQLPTYPPRGPSLQAFSQRPAPIL